MEFILLDFAMEFPVYLLNYLYMTKYKKWCWKIITKWGKLLIPRKPPFADPSSHYWEDISSKVSIKWNGHLSYSWYLFQERENKLSKKKKNQVADVQGASKTKEYTILRGTDTSIWIAWVFDRFFLSKKSQWLYAEQNIIKYSISSRSSKPFLETWILWASWIRSV